MWGDREGSGHLSQPGIQFDLLCGLQPWLRVGETLCIVPHHVRQDFKMCILWGLVLLPPNVRSSSPGGSCGRCWRGVGGTVLVASMSPAQRRVVVVWGGADPGSLLRGPVSPSQSLPFSEPRFPHVYTIWTWWGCYQDCVSFCILKFCLHVSYFK